MAQSDKTIIYNFLENQIYISLLLEFVHMPK